MKKIQVPLASHKEREVQSRPALRKLNTTIAPLKHHSKTAGTVNPRSAVPAHHARFQSQSAVDLPIFRPSLTDADYHGDAAIKSGIPFAGPQPNHVQAGEPQFLDDADASGVVELWPSAIELKALIWGDPSAVNARFEGESTTDSLPDSFAAFKAIPDPIPSGLNPTHNPLQNLPPYQLRPPSPAARLEGARYAGLSPWTGKGAEDVVDEDTIKRGFDPQIDDAALTFQSAKTGLWPILKHVEGLEIIETFFEKVNLLRNEKSRRAGGIEPPAAARVTFTEAKRELWFRDLADDSKELRPLVSKVPRGITGKGLLGQCLDKAIPTPRAIKLIRTVGALELKSFKKVGKGGMFVDDHKQQQWLKDWTDQVFEVTRTMVHTWGKEGLREKNEYVLRLTNAVCWGRLISLVYYFTLVLDGFAAAKPSLSVVWLVVVQMHWKALCSSRPFAVRLLKILVDRSKHSIFMESVKRLSVDAAEAFVNPLWPRIANAPDICVNVSMHLEEVGRRNDRFNPDAAIDQGSAETIASKRRLIDLVDSWNGDDIVRLAQDLFELCSTHRYLPSTLLDWATSRSRPGLERVYLIHRVLHLWNSEAQVPVHQLMLSWLTEGARSDRTDTCHDWQNVSILLVEMSRSGLLSPGAFLRWLIARGGLPYGPSRLRGVLLSISFDDAPTQILGLRNAILERTGYSAVSDEQAILAVQHLWADATVDTDHDGEVWSSGQALLIADRLNRFEGVAMKFLAARRIIARARFVLGSSDLCPKFSWLLLEAIGDLRSLAEEIYHHSQSEDDEIKRFHTAYLILYPRLLTLIPSSTSIPAQHSLSASTRIEIRQIVWSSISVIDGRDQMLRLPSDPVASSLLPPSPWSNPPDSSSPSVLRDAGERSNAKESNEEPSRVINPALSVLRDLFRSPAESAGETGARSPSQRAAFACLRSSRREWVLNAVITQLRASSEPFPSGTEDIVGQIVLSVGFQDILRIEVLQDWSQAWKAYIQPLLQQLITFPTIKQEFARRLGLIVDRADDMDREDWLLDLFSKVDSLSLPFYQLVVTSMSNDGNEEAALGPSELRISEDVTSNILSVLLEREITQDDAWLHILQMLPPTTSAGVVDLACSQYLELALLAHGSNTGNPGEASVMQSELDERPKDQRLHYILRKAIPIIQCASFPDLVLHLTESLQTYVQKLHAHLSHHTTSAPSPPPTEASKPPAPTPPTDPTNSLLLLALIPLLPTPSPFNLQQAQSPILTRLTLTLINLYILLSHPSHPSHSQPHSPPSTKSPTPLLTATYDTLALISDVLPSTSRSRCAAALKDHMHHPKLRFLFGSVDDARMQGRESGLRLVPCSSGEKGKAGEERVRDGDGEGERVELGPWEQGWDLRLFGASGVGVVKGKEYGMGR